MNHDETTPERSDDNTVNVGIVILSLKNTNLVGLVDVTNLPYPVHLQLIIQLKEAIKWIKRSDLKNVST